MSLEKMDEFFTARVKEYDAHMIEQVDGCREGYQIMADLVPDRTETLLDLGCGTGLELDAIFLKHPGLAVTGIDLTKAMLDRLKEKYPDKNLTLIHGNYFAYEFGQEQYDTAISFQTMHHFSQEDKIDLYRKIKESLKPGGYYIECDYMVTRQEEEDFFHSENRRLRKELGIEDGAFYHYDTPCTVDNQIKMLYNAGFLQVELVWRKECTTILRASL